jgi:serine/threonine protein kinase
MTQIQNDTKDWCSIGQGYLPHRTSCEVHRILEDTTDFYDVDYGDVILLNQRGYLVRGTESEKKFGLEGEPKPWVKSCVDLVTGEKKIVKLTFFEEFACRIEGLKYTCLRNPLKEARILKKIKGNPNFMQGFNVVDAEGNNVRVLDKIKGTSLDNHIRAIPWEHERYYKEKLPELLKKLITAFHAMADLHDMGEIHGDITPDHIYVEKDTGRFVWIDFDYDYKEDDDLFGHDIFEMGTLLAFVIGKDYLSLNEINNRYPESFEKITPNDMQSVFPNQLANLRIIHEHIDPSLNGIMLKFSKGSKTRYKSARQLADDLSGAVETLNW